MNTAVIGLVAMFFLGMGIFGLIAPATLIKPFGITLASAEARTEVRAVYGGFGVAIALLLACAAADIAELRPGAVVAVGIALAGMAFGRLVGRMADRPARFYPSWFYFWVESLGAAALIAAS
ncbi:DUF4345 family protein [Actinomadura rudentiformis]|uniref:DUF4345 domain-containing protein n=1 Tax=Actinomadura rudentiformis TaxID=359158 RepID=A0A6H9Y6Y6_9ACTN|nr:DUF4345 family protein [Actinomadura rudentiformis]KAB2340194.1 DUF4345 domain-containing protein [Actinomadura rudentiformis]